MLLNPYPIYTRRSCTVLTLTHFAAVAQFLHDECENGGDAGKLDLFACGGEDHPGCLPRDGMAWDVAGVIHLQEYVTNPVSYHLLVIGGEAQEESASGEGVGGAWNAIYI